MVIDDISALLSSWDSLVKGLVELGQDMIRQGLIKDGEVRLPKRARATAGARMCVRALCMAPRAHACDRMTPGAVSCARLQPACTCARSHAPARPSLSARMQPQGRDVQLAPRSEQELVDYEGMLVSGAAAQRRG